MKRLVVLAITLAGLFYFPSPSAAGQGHVTFQSSGVIFKPAPRAGVTPNRPFYRRGYPVSPYSYPPIPLIPPYASACYLPLRSSSHRRIFVFYTTKLLSVGSA